MQSAQALLNAVPNGNYVIAYSWYTEAYSTIDTSFLNSMNALGFSMNLLQDNMPFAMVMKKGYPSTKVETFGHNTGDTVVAQTLLAATWNRGNITSEVLGPAKRWESLHWNQFALENPTTDQVSLSICGLNSNTNNWDTLVSALSYNSAGRDTSLSWISPLTYPYLKLVTFTQDDSLRTPAQMKYWRVYYDQVPESGTNVFTCPKLY